MATKRKSKGKGKTEFSISEANERIVIETMNVWERAKGDDDDDEIETAWNVAVSAISDILGMKTRKGINPFTGEEVILATKIITSVMAGNTSDHTGEYAFIWRAYKTAARSGRWELALALAKYGQDFAEREDDDDELALWNEHVQLASD